MHLGLGEFRDSPTELWHSHSWHSSVRSTCGRYAHLPEKSPLFPSDWISFRCPDNTCKSLHVGRIYGVALDHRSIAPVPGAITLQIQEALTVKDLFSDLFDPPVHDTELVLTDRFYYVLESNVNGPLGKSCILDYDFGEDPAKYPRSGIHNVQPNFLAYLIRRHINLETMRVIPLCKTSPLRAELELKHFTRAHFIKNFDQAVSKRRCVSVPLICFIDGFGLYRNRQRSLMGMYLIMASFTFRERARRANVLPLTLGPHGSNFADVIAALQHMGDLDEVSKFFISLLPFRRSNADLKLIQGLLMTINGEEVFLCSFPFMYIGDMPQQQESSGFKSQNANLGCRFCYIVNTERDQLDYDLVQNGRFHHQALNMRKEMQSLRTKQERDSYATKWGINTNDPCLIDISPTLNILLSRPGDPAHSEYSGMTKQLHLLLIETILTTVAGKLYNKHLRQWPFPPGYARLQSPIHHLKSYSLAEHARWSIIIPALLRMWLRKEHIQPLFMHKLKAVLKSPLDTKDADKNAVDTIVKCFAALARSNCALMTDSLDAGDRASLIFIIQSFRYQYQQLLSAAAYAFDANLRSRSQTPVGGRSRQVSITAAQGDRSRQISFTAQGRSLSPFTFMKPLTQKQQGKQIAGALQPTISGEDDERSARASQYRNDRMRPNVHTALHYPMINEEYGLSSHCNVLIGEDKHRYFKKIVYQTNHSNVEKTMLLKENLGQTVRLLLMDGFKQAEPKATQMIKEIHSCCPSLFTTLLPRSEQMQLDDDSESRLSVVQDRYHLQPKAIGCLEPKYCREVLKLPTRSSEDSAVMSEPFKAALREAYQSDYKVS